MKIKIDIPQEFISEALALNVNVRNIPKLYKDYIENFIYDFHREDMNVVSEIYRNYLECNVD